MKKDEFYIGYNKKVNSNILKFRNRILIGIAVLFITIAGTFAIYQNKSTSGKFEFGKISQIEGVFMQKPYPMLRVKANENISRDILLLGFGKFGALPGLSELNVDMLDGKEMSISGTLIYYDGKTLFQLEPDLKNNIEIKNQVNYKRDWIDLGKIEISGEVIDPKCYFGVMKPGFGKIHRSCGVRCISGGIPPVYMTTNAEGKQTYMLLVNENGEPVNQEVLDYVGKISHINGQLKKLGEWLVIFFNPKKDITVLDQNSNIY